MRSRRRSGTAGYSTSAAISSRLPRAMEVLWLLTAGPVPVLFAPPDLMLFVDVPKVTVLRCLTGVMAMLWAVEWALRPMATTATLSPTGEVSNSSPLFGRVRSWTREQPSRWTLIAATVFLAANAVSTLLSQEFSVSLWGGNPGRDGYGFYNMASYYLLFVIVATHLKSRPQLWRLLGVITAAATVTSVYGVLQHYGLDPFHQGSVARVQSSFGNPLFAASFLVLALPISLGVGLVHVLASRSAWVGAGWAGLIAVQLAAVFFTLSRGPWIGLVVGIIVWLVLVATVASRHAVIRASLLLLVALGLALAVAMAPLSPTETDEASKDALLDRAASISTQLTTGGVSGRVSLWKRSTSLIVERPWFDSEGRGLVLVRHLVGYGPELFLYVLPLRWAPDALAPVNASAHNYLIHLTVELGLLGLVVYSSFVASLVIGGAIGLLQRKRRVSADYGLVYAALLASVGVHLVEQMTGVPRVSDTALPWTVAAVLTALPSVAAAEGAAAPSVARRQSAAPHRGGGVSVDGVWRWSVVVAVVVVGSAIVWHKNVSYAWAAALGSASVRAFQENDLYASMALMDRAIAAAPDVEFYYTGRARLMDAFATNDVSGDIDIATRQHALNTRALRASPLSHTARLEAAASALRLAKLGQEDKGPEAIRLYSELTLMLPGYEPGHLALASAHLIVRQPNEALEALNAYIKGTGGESAPSAEAAYLRGAAYDQLGRPEDAKPFLEHYLRWRPNGRYGGSAHDRLARLRN